MTCDELSTRVIDYLEGTLTADQRAELETHAGDCQACREQMRALRQTWVGLGDLPQEEPSPTLRERFYAMLDAEQVVDAEAQSVRGLATWHAGLGIRRLVGLASAAALLLVVGILVGTRIGGGSVRR